VNSKSFTGELSEDLNRIQFDRVHHWLTNSYWSPGIARSKVEKAAANSALVVSAFLDGVQVGYLRVISDRTTFAWICDVYVDQGARGAGIGKAMVRYALEHPEFQGLRRWALATKDAHGVYEACGFIPLPMPERWMAFLPTS